MNEELRPANQHPDFGKVCSHGQLKRKCYICELEDEIDQLKLSCSRKEMELFTLRIQNKKMTKALRKYEPIAVDSRFWAEEALKGE